MHKKIRFGQLLPAKIDLETQKFELTGTVRWLLRGFVVFQTISCFYNRINTPASVLHGG
jgi:hypothetical protein